MKSASKRGREAQVGGGTSVRELGAGVVVGTGLGGALGNPGAGLVLGAVARLVLGVAWSRVRKC